MTSVLVGASGVRRLEKNPGALRAPAFSDTELAEIDRLLTKSG